jgi:hypothetical protein
MKRIGAWLGFTGIAAFGISCLGLVLPGVASASTAGCAGAASMSTSSVTTHLVTPGGRQTVVKDVRVGQHSGCDRVTIEFGDVGVPSYSVGYVSKVVNDAKGDTVNLAGSAFMQVVLHGTSTSTPAPQPDLKPNFAVLREVRGAGDFESVTTYGLGLSSKQPFAAYRLPAPDRLVIDIMSPASGQVSQVPSGGVATGAGSTTEFPRTALVVVAGLLVAVGGGLFMGRHRITSRR